MPQDTGYYGDPSTDTSSSGDSSGDGDGTDPENASEDAQEGDQSDSETFLAPKSAFSGDVEPGTKMQFEAVKIYDDEIEWKPIAASDKGNKPSSSKMSDANAELDSIGS